MLFIQTYQSPKKGICKTSEISSSETMLRSDKTFGFRPDGFDGGFLPEVLEVSCTAGCFRSSLEEAGLGSKITRCALCQKNVFKRDQRHT